jgi:hypothetical protein
MRVCCEYTSDALLDPHTCGRAVEPSGWSVGRRDVPKSVSLLCGLTFEEAESYWHRGAITQDEWEGYTFAWGFFHPHSSLSVGSAGEAANATALAVAVGLVDVFTGGAQ